MVKKQFQKSQIKALGFISRNQKDSAGIIYQADKIWIYQVFQMLILHNEIAAYCNNTNRQND